MTAVFAVFVAEVASVYSCSIRRSEMGCLCCTKKKPLYMGNTCGVVVTDLDAVQL